RDPAVGAVGAAGARSARHPVVAAEAAAAERADERPRPDLRLFGDLVVVADLDEVGDRAPRRRVGVAHALTGARRDHADAARGTRAVVLGDQVRPAAERLRGLPTGARGAGHDVEARDAVVAARHVHARSVRDDVEVEAEALETAARE